VIIFLKNFRTFRDERENIFHRLKLACYVTINNDRNSKLVIFYFLSTYKYALERVFGHAFFPKRIMMTELAIPLPNLP
jgi:hypothetical protein